MVHSGYTILQGGHEVFRLGKLLGEGQAGQVFVCHDASSGDVCGACKCVPAYKLKDSAAMENILREVSVMLQVSDHENIVGLKSVHADKAGIYIVMELCSGGDLFEFLSSTGRMEEERASKLLMQILLALEHCHSKGIVHRDIKPENIMICESPNAFLSKGNKFEPRIKLADFGFANQTLSDNGRTLKKLCGSPLYIAPEIIRKQNYGSEVDIWSTGVIAYTVLCGFMPFSGKTDIETFRQILYRQVSFDAAHWNGVSLEAADFISSMLNRDPGERMTAADALQHPFILKHNSSVRAQNDCQSTRLLSEHTQSFPQKTEKRVRH
eukprot:TRINITY_DN2095_c0_g1_i2.p1 TRINITY_DN2095_c0_g1~~TRINITY_DN2095_c0_g1_i2.p1  ORF type:complete len:324 (+),score=26.05 TRINITY_DN2095_c0_g1_i2:115-1086(+)